MKGVHPDKRLFDLGLAVSGATLAPGQSRTLREIAAFCRAAGAPVSWQAISRIEQIGLKKLRVAFRFHKDPDLRELAESRFNK